jgi:hypothetical protein
MTRAAGLVSGALVATLFCPAARVVTAQTVRPGPTFELASGATAFLDPGDFDHVVVGGHVRFPLTPSLTIGPEITYMVGPGSDRDLVATGNLWVDLTAPDRSGPARIVPFLVVGGGIFTHSERGCSSTEASLTGGGGLRVWITDHVYVAPEVRLGWEPHVRAMVSVGVRPTRGR